ncbi:MAG: response regulator [Leptolyngbyaceae cyanobacterium MO_188.B28]|nr:response regulator [Leptolyngbyaceae cyanobacterium MO_188.B28]
MTTIEIEKPTRVSQVLVVDDSPVERKILSRILSSNGLDYTEACDGIEALETIKVNLPELIILDVEMPRMNGYEVCHQLKNDAKTHRIPILMCTSKAMSSDPYWGSRKGANAYVLKPYHTKDLIRKVKLLLSTSPFVS